MTVVHGKGSMVNKMPGGRPEDKFANLRAAYGFMMGHPGKKLLFMGQDFGQMDEWNENASIEWELLQYPIHSQMKEYVKELNALYRQHPALYEKDYHPDGFEWMNCMDYMNNIVVFVRKTEKPEETLLFVCNFAPVLHEKYMLGVPFAGKYKEIFNSDAERFGGSGTGNPRQKSSKEEECNGKENSITVQIPPLGILVFSCTPEKEPKKSANAKSALAAEKSARGKSAAAGKASVKENGAAVAAQEEAAEKTDMPSGETPVKEKGTISEAPSVKEDDVPAEKASAKGSGAAAKRAPAKKSKKGSKSRGQKA